HGPHGRGDEDAGRVLRGGAAGRLSVHRTEHRVQRGLVPTALDDAGHRRPHRRARVPVRAGRAHRDDRDRDELGPPREWGSARSPRRRRACAQGVAAGLLDEAQAVVDAGRAYPTDAETAYLDEAQGRILLARGAASEARPFLARIVEVAAARGFRLVEWRARTLAAEAGSPEALAAV